MSASICVTERLCRYHPILDTFAAALVCAALSCDRTDRNSPQDQTRSSLSILGTQFAAAANDSSWVAPQDYDQLYSQLVRRGMIDTKSNDYRADGWGNPYVLLGGASSSGNRLYVLGSFGPDGVWGTADDMFQSVSLTAVSQPSDQARIASAPSR